MSSNVTSVYLHVIQDVIQNVKEDFRSEGVDESVLQGLQKLWELKLMQSGCVPTPQAEGQQNNQKTPTGTLNSRPVSSAVTSGRKESKASKIVSGTTAGMHDLNQPYYEIGDEDDDGENTLLSTYIANRNQQISQIPMNPRGHPGTFGKPEVYMPRPDMYEQRSPLLIDMNAVPDLNDDGDALLLKPELSGVDKKRKRNEESASSSFYIPQTDGANDDDNECRSNNVDQKTELKSLENFSMTFFLSEQSVGYSSKSSQTTVVSTEQRSKFLHQKPSLSHEGVRPCIPSWDGADDFGKEETGSDSHHHDNEDEEEEDYNQDVEGEDDERGRPYNIRTPLGPGTPGSMAPNDEELGEEDDDADDLNDGAEGEDDMATEDIVFATYDKVTRAKNRWKCALKFGVMNLNRKDFLFSKGAGEFEF